MVPKKLWIYPLLFGITGALLGLILRYLFSGENVYIPFKHLQHSHSHTMMLGFLFNALILLVWNRFTVSMDRNSYRYFMALQIFMGLMMLAFLFQGYAFFSILFSTLHLWTSYILLIRLWKRLSGNKTIITLVRAGIIFHFLSSLGPYALGPLMALGLKNTPWYQQAIFFYLHFQFFGVYFIWILALLFEKAKITLEKKYLPVIIIGMVFLYAHAMDFSFDHILIHFFGGLGSAMIFLVFLSLFSQFNNKDTGSRYFYYLLLLVSVFNIAGSFPYFADLVIENRFILIAWLHFLFLGLYVPFIWYFMGIQISKYIWILYLLIVVITELLLLFPVYFTETLTISVMDLLYYAYFGVFILISTIHLKALKGFKTLSPL